MKLILLCAAIAAILLGRIGSTTCTQCPSVSLSHPSSGLPLDCRISENCLSVTCNVSTITPPGPSVDSVTITLSPCSTAVQVAVNGSSTSTSGVGVVQDELSQVQIYQGDLVVGYLEVIDWTVTETKNTLQFGTEVHSMEHNDMQVLFNLTISWTQNCTLDDETEDDSSTGESLPIGTGITSVAPHAPTTTITTTVTPPGLSICEALEGISGSSDLCQLKSCEEGLECSVSNSYRINVMILPCGPLPGVQIEVYYLLEQQTVLQEAFTESQVQTVRLDGELRLFDLFVSLNQSSPMTDHITLKLELVYPWGENLIVLPASLVPVDRTSCSDDLATTTAATPATPATPTTPTTSLPLPPLSMSTSTGSTSTATPTTPSHEHKQTTDHMDPAATQSHQPPPAVPDVAILDHSVQQTQPIFVPADTNEQSGSSWEGSTILIASASVSAVFLILAVAVMACAAILHQKLKFEKHYLHKQLEKI